MKLVVAKFGGSSLADMECIQRSAQIASEQSELGVVVVSAVGETTNDLTKLAKKSVKGLREEAGKLAQILEARHLDLACNLGVDETPVKEILSKVHQLALSFYKNRHYTPSQLDLLLSYGEQLSSHFMVRALSDILTGKSIELLDVRSVLKTDNQFGRALPLLDDISLHCEEILSDRIKEGMVFVTQGFVGSTVTGETTTLGRGGSDYSAALLAEGVGASELQIWTDVSGVATTDPSICSAARPLEELSFVEAAELATFGAKVLHSTTMWPAMRKGIPIYIGNSFAQNDKGTWVHGKVSHHPMVRAFALREQQSILTVSTPRMVSTYGFLYNIFSIFKKHKVSVDLVTTSEISVAITVSDTIVENKGDLVKDLSSLGSLEVERGYSLIGVIGNRITHSPQLGLSILESIADTNVRLLCTGASEHNLCLLVDSKSARDILKTLHKRFLEGA